MRKAIETSNGLKGGLLKGKAHYDSNGNPLGGIKAVVTDQGGKPIEVEGNEVIINKKTVQSDKVLTVKGTPKEILSTLNQMDGNGVAIGDEEAEILAKYRNGGSIPKEIIMYHGSKSKFDKFNMINNTLRGIELGSHFGTYEQAKSFMSERYGENDKFYIYKCKLNLENTLKVDDIGWWTADNIYRFILKNKRYKLDFNDIDISTPENILKILKEKNIDSFKYSNLYEGEGYSYLVFDSSKIEILDTEIFRNGGELIKRADGSYSRRGLWDNIRDNVGSGRKPTKQMLEQEAKIKSKYHLGGDMTKHLAPNGKPSNLTHEQWHLVRTPEFLDFFGNWINSPETASKVIDENGEPLVVYHGTNKEFTIFGEGKNKSILPEYKDEYLYREKSHYFHRSEKYAKTFGSEYGGYEKSYFLDIKNIEKVDEDTIEDIGYFKNIYDYYVIIKGVDGIFSESGQYVTLLNPHQIKLADGSNTTFDANNPDIRFADGGSISKMTPSELKAFYDSPEGRKLDAQTYAEWKRLVNMSKSDLEKFYNSFEGKKAGLSSSEANRQGIDSGRESARWIMKMKDIPYKKWSSDMWRWAKKQISFIKRMSGMKGSLYNDKGEKTRKHTALLIWGHNPEQKFKDGGDVKGYDNFKNPILINGFISNKEIDGKEIFLITYNSGGQEDLNVHQTMNPLAMLDAVEKKTGLHTNTLQVFIYEHTENSNRIETEDELEFLKDNYTVIIVDRDSVEFYNGDNPKQKFAGGGGIEDEFELELYQVRFDTDDDSEVKLVTTSYEDAKSEYEGATIGDFGDSEFNVSLEKKIDKYKFVYELDEDESIDDYPIEEYYDDSYYYELIEEGEFDNIENRVVTAFNSSSEDLLDEVQEWAKDKFGNYKYNTIDVYSEDDAKEENDPIGSIQLRIADHSQNESNLPYGIDRSLSVVIANKDATRGRFQQNRPQIYFDGSDSFDYVTSEIENYIEDAKEYIQSKKFEKGGRLRKFRGGGELSQKALAVETNDLTDFVRKYFIKDGRIDVSDAMQELFGNKRGKSIADEYRKRIGLHKKDGLTISQLAHKLWEEHRDEVREDIDDSDFRNAVEEVLISEYGVSSMIKSLMEKSGESEQDRENEYWMNQFDEGDDEYYEDLSDEEVADYFRDMEGFERELAKGTEHEMEHLDTLKKVAEGKITPEQAVVQTAKTHIEENPEYYEDLQKMELEALKDKLKNQGYNVTIPSGGNRISVMGYGKGYFNAKKQKADSILFSLKRNGYNAVSKLDADGYYDFWVYADEPKQDLAKMEMENKETYTYALTLRPFDIGTYPMENFIRLVEEEDNNYRFGLLEYSKPLSDKDIQNYSLAPVSELYKYDGVTFDYFLGNLGKANIKKTEGNIPYVDVDLYDKDTNELVETYDISGEEFLRNIGKDWKIIGDINPSEEESIPDLIEGLKVLADSLEGAEKKEIEDVIEGLEILLESEDKFEKGGELDNNSMFFEPSKADQEEEKRIMENQFGKNI